MIRWHWDGTCPRLRRTEWEQALYDAALSYVARGWHVLPVKGAGKHPATKHGVYDASADPAQVERWWSGYPGFYCEWSTQNIGIACGAASDLVVIDLDVRDGRDGVAMLEQLAAQHGPLPPCPVAGRGSSRHYYFKYTAGIRNSAGAIGPGIDVRADHGYVVAPPSLHPSGDHYRWIVSPEACEVPRLPDWLATLAQNATPPPKARRTPTPVSQTPVVLHEAMAEVADELANSIEGRIAQLRGQITVDDVLEEEGLDPTPCGCPLHDGNDPNFKSYDRGWRWHCHSQCQEGGDVIDLIQKLAKATIHQAVGIAESIVREKA